jgi:hypothetical protein
MPRPTSKAAWFSLAEICSQPFLLVSDKRFSNSQSQKLHGSAWVAASLSYWSKVKDAAITNLKRCKVQLGRDLPPAFPIGLR